VEKKIKTNILESSYIFDKFKKNGSTDCLTNEEKIEFCTYILSDEGKQKMFEFYLDSPIVKDLAKELNDNLEKKLLVLKNDLLLSGVDLAKVFFKYIGDVEKNKVYRKNGSFLFKDTSLEEDKNAPFNKALNSTLEKTVNKLYLELYDLVMEDSKKIDDNIISLFAKKFQPEKTTSGIEFFEKKLFSLLEKKYSSYKLAEKFLTYRVEKHRDLLHSTDKNFDSTEFFEFKSPIYKRSIELLTQAAKNNDADAQFMLYSLPETQNEKWLTKAASNGNELAISMLIHEYIKESKLDEAIELLKKYEPPSAHYIFGFSEKDNSKNRLNQLYLSVSNQKKAKELSIKNKALLENNKRIDDINHRMQKLVQQFTHSLGNVIFPDTIYQVAERLKNNPECRKDVLLLHEAYHSEIIIKLQGDLLRQRHANTDPREFRYSIRSCRRTPNSAEKTKSIEDILDYAASRVTARFLNQHYAGLNSIRDKMLSKKNLSLDALKQKFEDDILLNKSLRPIAWINQYLRPVQVTEISPLWQKVFILSESHAEALLFGHFSEILFNAFKYADHDKDEFLTVAFGEKNINDKTYLTCSWLNPVKDKSPAMLGTGKGLDAIQEDLKQLNDTESPEESLLISQQNKQFQVTLFFKKDLLVNDLPSLKIKRKANVE